MLRESNSFDFCFYFASLSTSKLDKPGKALEPRKSFHLWISTLSVHKVNENKE